MTSPAPQSVSPAQGLSRAEAMSLRPTRIKRVGKALELLLPNGQTIQMEGFYQPEVKPLAEQAMAKSAQATERQTVRGRQVRKAQELLEKALQLEDGATLQDSATMSEAGTLRNYWQVWQQWQSEALGLPDSITATTPLSPSALEANSAPVIGGKDPAMAQLPPDKMPVSSLQTSAIGLGQIGLPVIGLAGLAGGKGGSGGATPFQITTPSTLSVAENSLAVTKLDGNKANVTWSLDGSSDDNDLFSLTSSGELSFKARKDFESDKQIYTVKVKASVTEIVGGTISSSNQTQTLTISLTDVANEDQPSLALVANVGDSVSSAEALAGALKLGAFASGRPATITFTRDQASVKQSIIGTAGEIVLKLSESELQTLGSGSVNVKVVTQDDSLPQGKRESIPVTIDFKLDTVAPTISSRSFTLAENVVSVGTLALDEAKSETVTWSLAEGGADNARFTIHSSTGVLSWANGSGGDFEARSPATYALKVKATDPAGNGTVQDISVTLTDVAVEAVPNLALSPNVSGAISAEEAKGAFLTLKGLSNGLNVRLRLVGASGAVEKMLPASDTSMAIALTDEDIRLLGTGQVNVTAVCHDASGNTSVSSNALLFTLDGVAPQIQSPATFMLDENQAVVTTLLANEAVNWTIDSINAADSAQNSFFNLSSSGVLSFKNSGGGDYEFLSAYKVQVKATDSAGNTSVKSLTINLNDVLIEKPPTLALSNAVSGSISLNEATSAQGFITIAGVLKGQIVELSFTRSGGGTSLTKSITASKDQDLYAGLTAKEAQDLGDGAISVTAVIKSDLNRSAPSSPLNFTLETTAPQITSSALMSVLENVREIATLTANEPVTWALDTHYLGNTFNADAGLFTISSTGVLSWQSVAGRNFEAPQKSAENSNRYKVQVIATDSAGNSTSQNLNLTVTDANEAPSFVASTFQSAGATPSVIGQAVALPDFQVANEDANDVLTLQMSATNGSILLSGSPGGVISGTAKEINNLLKDLSFTAATSGLSTLTFKLYEGGNDSEGNLRDTRSVDLYTKPANLPVVLALSAADGQAAGSDHWAKSGDIVQFTLTLSEDIVVEGQPSITLTVGGNVLWADYTGGSGTRALVFTARDPMPMGWSGNFSLSSIQTNDTNRIFSKASPANALYTQIGQTDVNFKVDTTAPTIAPAVTIYHSRNLLVKTESEAWALLDNYDLSDLSVFAGLAGRFNSDSTRTKGGDLGWSPMSGYVPEYARGLLNLAHSGQKVSLTPIQSRFGWHLIYLEEVQRVAPGGSYHTERSLAAPYSDLSFASGDANKGFNLRISEGASNRVVQTFYAPNDEPVTWAWSDDTDATARSLFAVNASTGVITVKTDLSINADSTYALTLKTTDAAGNSTLRPLTITVTDTPILGHVSISGVTTEGETLTANYDMGAQQVAWRWQVEGADNQWTDLLGATGASLTLPKDDSLVGKRVRVIAMVTDATGEHAVRSDATPLISDAANSLPPTLPAGRNAKAEFIQVSGAHNGWLNANDFYINGSSIAPTPDTLSLALTLTTPVQVSGNPRVALVIGNSSVYATYDAANSTLTRLVFKYTAETSPARFDADGVSTSYYDANGASLTRADGTLFVPDFVNVTSYPFDSVIPVVPIVSLLDVARSPVSAREALSEDLVSIDNTGVGNTVQVIFARDNYTVHKTLPGANQSLRVRLSAQDLAVLGEGTVSVSVIVTDPAGNASWNYSAGNNQNLPANGGSFILDTVAPQISRLAYRTNENTNAIATLTASEPIKSWKLVSGPGDTNNRDFKLQESTGALTWAASGGQDFEAKEQVPYALRVELTDNAGNTRVEQLTVQLVNVNEALQLRWLGGTMVALPAAGASTSTAAFRSGAAPTPLGS